MDDGDDGVAVAGGLGRRGVLQGALGGFAGLLGAAAARPRAAAAAAPGDVVTPNPIAARIPRGAVAVELVEFWTAPATSPRPARARLNYLHHAGDGSRWLYACDTRGKLWRIDPAAPRAAPTLFLDLVQARGAAFLGVEMQMGLRGFAFHPDFARPGRPGQGRLYTATTETADSHRPGVRLFRMRPTVPVHHHNVLAEWRVRAGDPTRVDPASRRELFRIAQYGIGHCADQLLFRPGLAPGAPGYGLLLVGVGDGGNLPDYPDRYDHAQDLGRALGKILRIDPLAGPAGAAYRVPRDNPFVGRAGVLPEIWALGLRHPQNLSFDRGGTGALLIADIGQAQVEEINLGAAGANYGWPLREGTFATKRGDQGVLYALPAVDEGWSLPGEATRRPFAYPVAQYDRSEALDGQGRPIAGGFLAVAGGYVCRAPNLPALAGHYLCGDLVNGRIFHAPLAAMRQGPPAPLRELILKRAGREVTLLDLAGANERVDLRFGEGADGALYVTTKQDGKIRKLAPSTA